MVKRASFLEVEDCFKMTLQEDGFEVFKCLRYGMVLDPTELKSYMPMFTQHIDYLCMHFSQMNEILGDDYEKKMAVVGVLKQYAEDRDIDMLARALSVILKTPHQRRLLRQIRPFIPPRQRIRFDDITRQQQQYMAKMKSTPEKSINGTPSASHKLGQRRALQIVRENNSFGFVIKGSNPAYIETVDPNGAAEKGGLQPGDFVIKLNGIDVRKCSHAHLVQLLQDSGTAPILEVLRCDQEEYPYSSGAQGSNSSASSTSSHAESDWTTQDNKLIVDKEGRTYLERAEFLLTTKERSKVKKAWIEYESTSNIVELFESVSAVLDTPSKKTLWMFILARLSPPHQQYCINQISLPRDILLECIEKIEHGRNHQNWSGDGDTTSTSAWGSRKSSIKISSFQQQVEYLLTSRERSMLKKALQLYSENRNVDNLIEDLDVILDTPSKRTLWMYIIPLLTQMHQDVVRQRVGTKQVTSLQTTSESESTLPKKSTPKKPYMSSDEEHDFISRSGDRKSKSKPTAPLGGLDLSIIKELEETRRAVQEVKEFLTKGQSPEFDRENFKYVTVIPIERQLQESSLRSPISIQLPGQKIPMTLNSQNIPGVLNPSQRLYSAQEVQNLEGRLFSPVSNSGVRPHLSDSGPRVRFPANFMGFENTAESDDSPRSPPSFVIDHVDENSRLKIPPNFMTSGTESDNEIELERRAQSQLLVSKFAKMGGDTFNRHALTALKQLDAAVAAEVSDLENSGDAKRKSADVKVAPSINGETTSSVPAPPPPPPPPVAPPPPAPQLPGTSSPDKSQMNVKRINWEKLDQQRVENTVWEQIGEATDLQDVVRYLELEQYFSTKSPRHNFQCDKAFSQCTCVKHRMSALKRLPEKKSKICILNPKKAYNLSIILGQLKLTLSEIRHALYMLDEEVLTPELLRQLLSYAPNKQEMEQLDSYNGDIVELSPPDRFTYEMSRVPGYEQRLKALVFKGNFQEKISEMKDHLQHIRKASLELRHSKKLSKILELILAMGNYMNQGNQRVGEAAGFKIRFLSQLEITKTSDNKLTFLHVLAEAVFNKFPELVAVGEELTTVPAAAKFSNVLLNQELQDLRKVLQDISNTLEKFGSQKTNLGINDKFQDVMGHFISQASDEIQSLFRLNANTMEEFHSTVQYFGEDPKKVTTTELFGVFAEFITKFEKAHRHNIMYKRYANEKT